MKGKLNLGGMPDRRKRTNALTEALTSCVSREIQLEKKVPKKVGRVTGGGSGKKNWENASNTVTAKRRVEKWKRSPENYQKTTAAVRESKSHTTGEVFPNR